MADKSRPARLVIAGIGLVGRQHAGAIDRTGTAELTAIVDPSAEGRDFARSHGVPHFASLEEMFARIEPDGVILATPTPLHVEQGLACIARGCPVLVEKPIADAAREAERLVAAARQAGVPLLTGHHRRHNPLIAAARAVVDAGEIGEIRALHSTCWLYKPDSYFDIAPWRRRKGAGPISVNLAHDIDLLRHLCGEVTSVQAQAAPSRRGAENEDVASALLVFANGAIGTITVSDTIAAPWSWELTARENPAYAPTAQSSLMIGGTKGSLSIPDLTLWSHAGEPDWWAPMRATTLTRAGGEPMVNQIAHFAAVIAGQTEPLVSGQDGLETLRVIEAIQRAAATGETVRP